MRLRWLTLAIVVTLFFPGCGSLGGSRGSSGSEVAASQGANNQHTYQVDYDRTFNAVSDALERIDNNSTNLERYDTGNIVSKMSDGSGTINARVTRIDERNTRVDLLIQKKRGFWRKRPDAETAEAFFRTLDEVLSSTAMEKDEEGEAGPTPASPRRESADGLQDAASEKKKNELIVRLKQKLQLAEEDRFLEELSPEALAILETKLRALGFLAAEKKYLAKKCSACYIDLARFYHDAEQYARSAEALKIAIANDPDSAVAHCNLGEIYKHLHLFQDAIRELNEAKKLNPDLPDIYINLGIIYDDYVVDDQEALRYYTKYLELGGTDKQVLDWISQIEKEGP